VLGFLPGIERIDQIKPGPRHVDVWMAAPLEQGGFDHPQTLVEREPRRPGMPRQHVVLLDGGVEAEPKRRMPCHR
jgi:hypothetical protein